jgi:hypothetical protein
MSDYTLDIETKKESAELFELLIQACGFTKISEEVAKKDGVIAGVSVTSDTGPRDKMGRSIFQQAYGFNPNVSVWIKPSSSKEFTFSENYLTILQSVISLLEHFSGNAVLLCNGEQTVLQRMNGHLQIDIKWYEGISLEGFGPDNIAALPSPLL